MSDVDGAQDDHLAELAERQGEGIDAVFGHCSGYPEAPASVPARLAFLRARAVRADTSYVNRPGRTVAQVRDEARLRDAIEAYLDSARPQLEGCSALDARAQVQAFVAGDPAARVRRARPRRSRSSASACARRSTCCGCRRRCSCSRRSWSSRAVPGSCCCASTSATTRRRTSAPTRPPSP